MKLKSIMVLIVGILCSCSVSAYSINGAEGQYLEGDISYTDIEGNTITIMEYNLGATDDNMDGFLFQWGYNHAYSNTGALERSVATGEESSEYYKYIWYLNNYQNFNWDVDDQGPCPTGYHVPSMNEWNNLLVSWCDKNDECDERYLLENYEMFQSFGAPYDGLRNQWMFYDNDYNSRFGGVIRDFLDDFNLSLPGFRNYDDIVNLGFYGNYWSSTILSRDYGIARFFYAYPVAWMGPHFGRGYGQSLRCFKNTYMDDVAPETFSLELFKGGDGINDSIDILNDDWLGRKFLTENMQINQESLTLKSKLEQPSEGYEWVWYKDNAKNQKVGSGENITGSYTKFYVFLEQNSYKLVFNKNYGEAMSGGEEMIVKYLSDGEQGDKELPSISRVGYKFLGWNTDPDGEGTFYSPGRIEGNIGNIGDEIVLYAQWGKLGYSGGGGKSSGSAKVETENHNSADDELGDHEKEKDIEEKHVEESAKNLEENENNGEKIERESVEEEKILDTDKYDVSYTEEFNRAYQFAYNRKITTKSSIKEAKLNDALTRIEMAKMLSQYAMNVMGKQPDLSKGIVEFKDVTKEQDVDYDNAVTLAYQLGIMGINMPNNCFRPDDIVTRAEFVAAFSRMLYGTSDGVYKSTRNYYVPHMEGLFSEGIITITEPTMKEKRGNVMIMLMRSVE